MMQRVDQGSRTARYSKNTTTHYVNIDCYGYKPHIHANHTRTGTFTWSSPEKWENRITWDGNGKQFRHNCGHVRESSGITASRCVVGARALSSSRYSGSAYNVPWYDEQSFVPSGGGLPPDIPSSSLAPASLDWRKAYETLLDDASGVMPSDISIGTNIAEFAQLKWLFKKPAKSITRIVRYVTRHPNRKIRRWRYLTDKKGKIIPWTLSYDEVELRSFKWSLKDLAASHLAMQFGVLPLADDIGNWLAKYWQVRNHLTWWKQLYRGKQFWARARTPTVVVADSMTKVGTGQAATACGVVDYDLQRSLSAETYGILAARISAIPKEGLALQNALLSQVLGLNAPLQLAWELVPFSFVVDWFYPIGDLLSRIDPKRAIGGLCRNLRVLETWHTVVHQAESKVEAVNFTYTPPQWRVNEGLNYGFAYSLLSSENGAIYKKYRSYSRQQGMPDLNFAPVAKSRYGLKQALISLALIVQKTVK